MFRFFIYVGGPCPVGHYCPEGTSNALECPSGSYAVTTGLSVCIECVAGYYCEEGTIDYSGTPCPVGHYCLAATSSSNQYPCPIGTYNNYTGICHKLTTQVKRRF